MTTIFMTEGNQICNSHCYEEELQLVLLKSPAGKNLFLDPVCLHDLKRFDLWKITTLSIVFYSHY
ncbi:unnamed protein product, partial [Linum tenue]